MKKTIKNKNKNVLNEIPKQVILSKFDFLMRMNIGDLIVFFDLVNAISTGANNFVTENELVLSVKDKLNARVRDFKILTPVEVNKILTGKEVKFDEPARNYLG